MFTAIPFFAALFAPPAQAQAHDIYGDHRWVVEIDGLSTGAFKSVDGLDSEVEVRLMGADDLDRDFVAWLESGNKAEPLDLVLIEVDARGGETHHTLVGAVPADTNVEEVTLVVEKIEKG